MSLAPIEHKEALDNILSNLESFSFIDQIEILGNTFLNLYLQQYPYQEDIQIVNSETIAASITKLVNQSNKTIKDRLLIALGEQAMVTLLWVKQYNNQGSDNESDTR